MQLYQRQGWSRDQGRYEMTRSTNITEQDAFEGTVAEEAGLVRGVKLLGLRSKNRRNYDTPGVRKSAGELMRGCRIYIDHPERPDAPRSYRDAFGVVESHEFRAGQGHFGDIRFNPEHPLAKQFTWDVKNNPSALGMSINAKIRPGKTDRNGDVVVESLEMVRSIDIVTRPGTAEGIFEADSSADTSEEDAEMDLKTLKEKHADLLEQALAEKSQNSTAEAEKAALAASLKEAQEQLEAIKAEKEAAKRRADVEKQVGEALEGSAIVADDALVAEIVECACEMQENAAKKFTGVLAKISKISPMLAETDEDDEDQDGDPVGESADEDDDGQSGGKNVSESRSAAGYRPSRVPSGAGTGRQKAGKKYSLSSVLGLKAD